MIVKTLEVTGDAATHPVSAELLKAKWVQVVTPNANASEVRIGESTTDATHGFPIPKGWAGQLLPPSAELTEFYDLSQLFYYAANNDKIYFLYA